MTEGEAWPFQGSGDSGLVPTVPDHEGWAGSGGKGGEAVTSSQDAEACDRWAALPLETHEWVLASFPGKSGLWDLSLSLLPPSWLLRRVTNPTCSDGAEPLPAVLHTQFPTRWKARTTFQLRLGPWQT